VQRTGDRIRITAQLIDAKSGFHLWSQTYDRELGDIFAIEDDISAAIVDALRDRLGLGPGKIGNPRATKAINPEAYSEYLLGRHRMNLRTPDDFKAAIQHFKRAIELDESYAPPYANLAITYGLLAGFERLSDEAAFELAKPFAERAMALDPELAEAHGAMFFMQGLKDIHDPEFKYLNRAIALNPAYMDARNWKTGQLVLWSRIEEANAFRDSSLKIDPLSIILNINLASSLLQTGRRDEAKAVIKRLKSIDFGWGQRFTGEIAYARGDLPEAIEAYLFGLKSIPQNGPLRYHMAFVLSELGLGEEAQRLFPRPRGPYVASKNAGRWDLVLQIAKEGFEEGHDNSYFLPALAEGLYFNRDLKGAVTHYDQLSPVRSAPKVNNTFMKERRHIFFAAAFREVGKEQTAKVLSEAAMNSVEGKEVANYADGPFYQRKGLILLYQAQNEEALDAFELAFEAGNRNAWEFAAPLFDPLRDHPRFLALQKKYEAARAENRAGALALICGGDLPDIGWVPLPETCAGYVEG
ncbi:MAG: hypothetical protein V3R73_07725, partial [Sphingomonadales bacterium]